MCERVAELSARLDPIRLLRQMRVRQQSLVDIADKPVAAPSAPTVPPLEQFLAGLRIAWREGEARPTAIPVAKPKRGRRRPDPLVKVWRKEKATAMVFGELGGMPTEESFVEAGISGL